MVKAQFDHKEISQTLIRVIKKSIASASSLEISQEPETHEKNIIEYNSKMRIFGLEKFNGPTYVSYINFYRNPTEMEAKNTIGAFILYLEEENIIKFLNSFGHRGFNEEDQDVILDHVTEFCNLCATNLKSELTQIGYNQLEISAPTSRYNDIAEGIDFEWEQQKYSEVDFYFWKIKYLIASCTLGSS